MTLFSLESNVIFFMSKIYFYYIVKPFQVISIKFR